MWLGFTGHLKEMSNINWNENNNIISTYLYKMLWSCGFMSTFDTYSDLIYSDTILDLI